MLPDSRQEPLKIARVSVQYGEAIYRYISAIGLGWNPSLM